MNSISLFIQIFMVLLISKNYYVESHSFPMTKSIDGNSTLPTVWSYHIHCMFISGDKSKVKQAVDLRNKFSKNFQLESEPACKDLFDDMRLCMFNSNVTTLFFYIYHKFFFNK